MKYLILPLSVMLFLLASCGADQATVDKMSGEMCAAMEVYNEEDISSMMDAAEKMTEVAMNTEYSSVTEAQLKETMEAQCPDGFKKFMELAEGGGE